jgi:hypothetical protein
VFELLKEIISGDTKLYYLIYYCSEFHRCWFTFFLMHRCYDTRSKSSLAITPKTYLFSEQIGMPLENVLKFIGYMDIVLFLTISNSDIYQPKSLGKSETDFYPSIRKPEKVAIKY